MGLTSRTGSNPVIGTIENGAPALRGAPFSIAPLQVRPVLFAQSANKELAPLEKSRPLAVFGRE